MITVDEYYDEYSYEQSLESARKLDLNVVIPANNQIFIDIDSEEAFDLHQDQRLHIEYHLPDLIVDSTISFSKSGAPHRHITLTLAKSVSNLERIALQAILGSHLKRELISYIKESQEDPHPTLFFEKKQYQLQAAPELLQISGGNFLTDSDIPY